jgi:hypothetical protein
MRIGGTRRSSLSLYSWITESMIGIVKEGVMRTSALRRIGR